MNQRLFWLWGITAGLIAIGTPGLAQQAVPSSQILESSGRASVFELGQEVGRYLSGLEEISRDLYSARTDDGVRVATEGKIIREIQLRDRKYFTQRLVRPQASTVANVIQSYGKPKRICSRDGKVNLVYGGIEFQSTYQIETSLKNVDPKGLLGSYIEAITLRQKGDFEKSFLRGLRAKAEKNWEELARSMERTLCDEPSGERPKTVKAEYGTWPEDYTPRYLLGLAWLNLDRCAAAFAEWEESAGDVPEKDLQAWQQQCLKSRGS